MSGDSGLTWTEKGNGPLSNEPIPDQQWQSIASSSLGNVIVACVGGPVTGAPGSGSRANIWYSDDIGVTWNYGEQHGSPGTQVIRNWWGVASNGDGSRLVATIACGPPPDPLPNCGSTQIWTSADNGASWLLYGPGTNDWRGIASDHSGDSIAAVVKGGNIWLASPGPTWVEQTGANKPTSGLEWNDVAMSSDGKVIVAVPYNGNIWKSTDSGATWTEDTTVGSPQDWGSVTSNAAGDRLAAVAVNGNVWTWPYGPFPAFSCAPAPPYPMACIKPPRNTF